MRNKKPMKFKPGIFIKVESVWGDQVFKILLNKNTEYYILQSIDNDNWIPSIHISYEDDIEMLTKKKNPEYWL